MRNEDLPTSPPPASAPTYTGHTTARMREIQNMCVLCLSADNDADRLDLLNRICLAILNPNAFPKHDVHDAGHKWPIRHFVVGQTLRVSPQDIVNLRQSIQRLQKCQNMKFTTAKQLDGYYIVKRTA